MFTRRESRIQIDISVLNLSYHVKKQNIPMKFNDFPIELKDMIMSFLSPKELCSIVAPVSKEWHVLAYDYVKWKILNFAYPIHSDCAAHRDVPKILQLTRPYRVRLYYFPIYDYHIRPFPICQTVQELICSCCDFACDYGLEMLVHRFPNIRKLVIELDSQDYQSLGGTHNLQQWKNLKSLELINVMFEDYANYYVVQILEKINRFEEVVLVESGDITDKSFKTIVLHQKQNLRKFSMWFDQVSRKSYKDLLLFHKLTHLTICWPKYMRDKELLLIMRDLNTLTYFQVEHGEKLFSSKFGRLFNDVIIPGLVELTIGNCNKLDNAALKQFVKCLPSLKALTLRNLNEVNDEGLESLVKIGRNLEMLYFNELKSISENCLRQLALELPNMRELVAFKCPKVGNGEKFEIIFKRTYRLTKIL